MKILALAFLAFYMVMNQVHAEDSQVLKTPKDKVSYIIGIDIGKAFKKQGLDIDSELLLKGIKDSLAGDKFLLSEQEIREIMAGLQQKMAAQEAEQQKKLREKNKMEGEAFWRKTKRRPVSRLCRADCSIRSSARGRGKNLRKRTPYRLTTGAPLLTERNLIAPTAAENPPLFPWAESSRVGPRPCSSWKRERNGNYSSRPILPTGRGGRGEKLDTHAVLIFEVELISVQASQ